MDRRGFLKFMGVSAAATSASSLLANIPEAVPRIELLEPKKIISSVSDDVILFDRIAGIHIEQNDNLMFRDSFGQGAHPQLGQYEFNGKVTVYPTAEQQYLLMDSSNKDVRRVAFDCPQLRGKLFVLSGFELEASAGEHTTVELNVVEIRNTGQVKLS